MVQTKFTYAEVRKYSRNLSKFLRAKLGLNKGDVVLIYLPNCPQFPITTLGCLEAGLIASTANSLYTAGRYKYFKWFISLIFYRSNNSIHNWLQMKCLGNLKIHQAKLYSLLVICTPLLLKQSQHCLERSLSYALKPRWTIWYSSLRTKKSVFSQNNYFLKEQSISMNW